MTALNTDARGGPESLSQFVTDLLTCAPDLTDEQLADLLAHKADQLRGGCPQPHQPTQAELDDLFGERQS